MTLPSTLATETTQWFKYTFPSEPGKLLDYVTFQGFYQAHDFIMLYIMHLTVFPLSQLIFPTFVQVA